MTTIAPAAVLGPGIHDGVPNAEYHAHPALSSTGLRILASKTPAHYRWAMDHPEHKAAYDLGTAAHSLVLEDDTSNVDVLDFDDWRTKAAREARDESYADGRVPLLAKDWALVVAMRDAVAAHPVARLALTGGHAERSVITEHTTGTMLRVRPDKHLPDSPIGPLIVDLKSTVNADPRHFGRTAADFGYHQSDALYRDVLKTVTGEDHKFLFVLLEKTAPHLVSVVELDDDAVDLGRRLNERAIHTWMRCDAAGEWPGYPTTDPVGLPAWAAMTMEESLNV